MNYRKKISPHVGVRFLAAAAVLSLAVAACGDDDDGADGDTAGTGGKNTAGAGGKSTAGTGGKSTAGSNNTAGNGTAGNGTAGNGTAGTPTTAGNGGTGNEAGSGGGGGDAPLGGGGSGNEAGTGGDGGGEPAETALVFGDDYGEGVSFVQFGGSANDLSVDTTEHHAGNASLKIVVPAGGYTGGALAAAADVDLSGYNAISFWAKASAAHTFDKVGFANDAANATPLQAELLNLALTTEWQHFIVPIPAPSKVAAENGLFHFAEGGEDYTVWLDSIDYVTVAGLGDPTVSIGTSTKDVAPSDTFTIPDVVATWTVDAAPVALTIKPAWLDYVALDEAVASVSPEGVVTAEGPGSTTISAELDGTAATGLITVNVANDLVPAVAAPTPTNLEADVFSLFSNAYTDNAVATWSADWDQAALEDITVATNATKVYKGLVFAGIDFGATYDVSTFTHLHVDVWLPVATSFKLKLVDFGANGAYAGGDDTEGTAEKTGLTTKAWQSLDFDLTTFTGLAARAHIAQIIVLGSASETVYFDNVYFYKPAAP
jgi:hypothetical protein